MVRPQEPRPEDMGVTARPKPVWLKTEIVDGRERTFLADIDGNRVRPEIGNTAHKTALDERRVWPPSTPVEFGSKHKVPEDDEHDRVGEWRIYAEFTCPGCGSDEFCKKTSLFYWGIAMIGFVVDHECGECKRTFSVTKSGAKLKL